MTEKKSAVSCLNNLTAARFLREYWQKKPLLIRNAFPGFNAPFTPREVLRLAQRDDAESRLITHRGREWNMQHGPISARDLKAARESRWTVLVQDVQHFSQAAHELLAHFDFIPRARIDDLMVSCAVKGGGVGPHFDSYDVFLLQGNGRRRWQISAQRDLSLVPDMPLKILARFKPEQEWVLNPGDMLYLPPSIAHNGIAESDDCLTWSIGFRAPSRQELSAAFLDYLRDELVFDGLYEDADLRPTDRPARIDAAMNRRLAKMLDGVAAAARDGERIRNFAGCYLTEPKSHVFFDAPGEPLSAAAFRAAARKRGIVLDLKTRMLYQDDTVYANGEALDASAATMALMRTLADRRALSATDLKTAPAGELLAQLHNIYCDGWLHIG